MFIFSKSPLRVSFIGGGTDYCSYFEAAKIPGFVFGMTINRFVYTSVFYNENNLGDRLKLDYREREIVYEQTKIKHPIIREVLRELSGESFLELSTHADVPAGTGLGSSSSFCVGLISALARRNKITLSRDEVASIAVRIEREVLQESGGLQDQYFASFGGCIGIEFEKHKVSVRSLQIDDAKNREIKKFLSKSFLLVPLGQPRASQIIAERTENRALNQLKAFEEYALKAKNAYQDFQEARSNADRIEIMEQTIVQSNQFKLRDIESSSTDLEIRSGELQKLGVVATKICGAGTSGYILALVMPAKRNEILSRINSCSVQKAFPIELYDKGCRVTIL
jgi:D-glycero-alpha-D-manno-heptose-7-phosphate kinase